MATASSAQRLQDEASCSLCHKYFTQPVSVDCGHSFCQSCITQHWEKWGSDFSCPRCGEICLKRKFRPNKELENFVQIAKQMNVEVAESVGGEKICETHQEPLKLFCKDEQKLMCSTCVESKDQTNQTFVPVEEAVQDYKEKLETQLQAWRQKREKAFNDHTGENDKCKMFRNRVDTEKRKVVSEFEEVKKFLEQQEKNMLNELEELAKEGEKFVTKLSGDVYFSDTLIHEMEEKSRQPPTTFLLGIEETLNMCKVEFQQQHVFSGLEKKLNAFSKKHLILQETVRVFREDLPQQLEVNNEWNFPLDMTQGASAVTLDPDTAHCNLMVSDRQKKLTSTKNKRVLTDYPQRFIFSPCVLGCEAFTSGRHYWEMDVGKEGYWAVGVARESVERKEYIQIKSDEGIWALEKACSSSLTADSVTLQCNPACLRTIGIYLNYGKNRVCFFDAQRRNILHTFHSASFKDEKIRPFFWLKNGDRAQAQCWIWLSY